jgi:hypothetical protein
METKDIRYLNQIELERLQTIPQNYTEILTRNQAAECLGNGWTVDVIKHIFSFLPMEYQHVDTSPIRKLITTLIACKNSVDIINKMMSRRIN